MGPNPDELIKKELELAEHSLGEPGSKWQSDAPSPHAAAGSLGGNQASASLEWLKQVGSNASGGVGDYLDPPDRKSPAKDPLALVRVLEQQLRAELSWPGDERFRAVLFESMSSEKIPQVLKESAVGIWDNIAWIAPLLTGWALVRRGASRTPQGAATVQLIEVGFALTPLKPHLDAWFQAVQVAATTTNPQLAKAAMEQAQLNYAHVVVNAALVAGLAAKRSPAPESNRIIDITPKKQVPALPGLVGEVPANPLLALSQSSGVRQLMSVFRSLSPTLRAAALASGPKLGSFAWYFSNSHQIGEAGGDAPINLPSLVGAAPKDGDPNVPISPSPHGGDRAIHVWLEVATGSDIEIAVSGIVQRYPSQSGPAPLLNIRAQALADWLRTSTEPTASRDLIILDAYLGRIERAHKRLPYPHGSRELRNAAEWLANEITTLPAQISRSGRAVPNDARLELSLIFDVLAFHRPAGPYVLEMSRMFRQMTVRLPPGNQLEDVVDMPFVAQLTNALEGKFPWLRQELEVARNPPMPAPKILKPYPYPIRGTVNDRAQWLFNEIQILPVAKRGELSDLLANAVADEKGGVAVLATIFFAKKGSAADFIHDVAIEYRQFQAAAARTWNPPSAIATSREREGMLAKIDQKSASLTVERMFSMMMGRAHSGRVAGGGQVGTGQGPLPPDQRMMLALRSQGYNADIVRRPQSGIDPTDWLNATLGDMTEGGIGQQPLLLMLEGSDGPHAVLVTAWEGGRLGQVSYYDPRRLDAAYQEGNVRLEFTDDRPNETAEVMYRLARRTLAAIVPRASFNRENALALMEREALLKTTASSALVFSTSACGFSAFSHAYAVNIEKFGFHLARLKEIDPSYVEKVLNSGIFFDSIPAFVAFLKKVPGVNALHVTAEYDAVHATMQTPVIRGIGIKGGSNGHWIVDYGKISPTEHLIFWPGSTAHETRVMRISVDTLKDWVNNQPEGNRGKPPAIVLSFDREAASSASSHSLSPPISALPVEPARH
jgi:hypothetical protein